MLKPIVAVATLLGAANVADAAEAAGRVPDLAETPLAERRRWARWLYRLSPAGPDGRLGSLQPDLLGKHTWLVSSPATLGWRESVCGT